MKAFFTPRRVAAAVFATLAGFATAAGAASLQIYKQPNFTGQEITLFGETPNLSGLNFANQGSSLVVTDSWEICSQPDYKGDCVQVGPGRYSTLDTRLNHRMESARPVRAKVAEVERERINERFAQGEARREARVEHWDYRDRDDRRPRGRASLELYQGAGFRGQPLAFARDDEYIDGFFDRGASLVVHEGSWQVCSQPEYRGRCRVYEPGRYESIARMGDIASVRRVR